MKKVFLFLALSVVFASCKDNKPKTDSPDAASVSTQGHCDFFDELEGMTVEEQVAWLKSKEADICSDYSECIADSHQLDSTQIAAVEANRNSSLEKTVTLGDIFDGNGCSYAKYRSFKIESDHTITMDIESDFTTSVSCYSLPLFYGLQKKHNLTTNTQFHFFEASVPGVSGTTVVFVIDGVSNGYFDYSRWPKLFPEKNPL